MRRHAERRRHDLDLWRHEAGNHSGPKVWDLGLRHRLPGTLFRGKRDIDDEDATFAGHIADTDLAAVRPYRFPGDRESQAEARSIAATPIAKLSKQVSLARRNSATLVLGLDEQPAVFGARSQDHAASWRRVLEGVVQQVHHGRRKELRV